MTSSNVRFCGYPSAFIYEVTGSERKEDRIKHLFWGDTIVLPGERQGDYVRAKSRDAEGWMKESDLLEDPLLDIIFLDVGQGDSCLIVTPADEKVLVDAGKEDHLLRYLRWRYKNYETPEMRAMGGKITAVIISHPDNDHYLGLKSLIEDPKFGPLINIDAVYHNGIFTRKGSGLSSLGALQKEGKVTYISDPVVTHADLEKFFTTAPGWDKLEYPKLIHDLRLKNAGTKFLMLNQTFTKIPNLTPVPGMSVTVLGPILEKIDGGQGLRTFGGDVGKTKNGHSIILLLRYKNIRILLGGDLNIPSEKFLLEHYATLNPFEAEVLKAYHHGSGDFAEEFIESIKPYVSVISSGDNESYSHPRADTMGFLGKASRGRRPLLFSTELARSAPEIIKNPIILKQEFKTLTQKLGRTDLSAAERSETEKKLNALEDTALNRSVAVYGAINLRTDGEKLLMCQKKEAPNKEREEWDIYKIAPDASKKQLVLVP